MSDGPERPREIEGELSPIEGELVEKPVVRRKIGRRSADDARTSPDAGAVQRLEDDIVEIVPAAGDTDVAEAKFAELQVSAFFVVAALAAVYFVVAYVTVPIKDSLGQWSNYALGGSLAVALLSLGAGMIVWAKKLLPHERAIQDRHDFHSSEEEEIASENTFLAGIDDLGLGKRKILRRTLIGALGLLPLPILVLLRDLGPLPHAGLRTTGWKKGKRLVDPDTRLPYKLGDLEIGSIATVMPEGFVSTEDDALAPTILIRFGPGQILSQKESNWGVDDHVAYSKICTHAGCPISLYEQQTHNLLCPCHQSTFDMARDAKVIFGPAARPLPQLRIGLDPEGYFIALGPYSQPTGPSFWERR